MRAMSTRKHLVSLTPISAAPSYEDEPAAAQVTGTRGDELAMERFVRDMRLAKQSGVTIAKRVELLRRLEAHLDGKPLLEATRADLQEFQVLFIDREPATLDIYTRHIRAFYLWAYRDGRITTNPAADLILPKVPKGRPHPTHIEDLETIFAIARGTLRMAYILAAFAGFRCGEVCRFRIQDADLRSRLPTALVFGKGGKERVVPLVGPVVGELRRHVGQQRTGWVVVTPGTGTPFNPPYMSSLSSKFLSENGIDTTLHSMRHFYGTTVGQQTRDPLFVRDLLGHESVSTTEIYMQSSMTDGHARLAAFAESASGLLHTGMRAVS